MNVIIIASAVAFVTLLVGLIIAGLFAWLGQLVVREQASIEDEKRQYNLALTMGHEIPVDADTEVQLKTARTLAAKRAASLPRGENLAIGKLDAEKQPTAFDGVANDPISAVKIASVHGWQALQTGAVSTPAAGAAVAPKVAQTVPPAKSIEDLEPGKDYPFIEITEDMDPAEIRKARIANAKARSAAVKALKEAGAAPAAAAPVVESTTPEPEAQPAAAIATGAAVAEPVPGVDYAVIEITDDMDPAEIRQARIANAKAKSSAMKAFKAAGGSVSAPTPAPETAPPPAPTPAPQEEAPAATAVPADIPKPDYVEITDDMDPAEIRSARISNAKAKAAYTKALKAAGIDPASVSE